MNRIRVLQISSGFAIEGPSGGLGRFAMELSRRLDPDKVESILCGLWDHGTPLERQRLEQLQAEGVEAFTAATFNEAAPYRQFWAAYRIIRRRLAGRQVDVIHSHEQFGDVMTLLLRPFLHPKAVIRTVHNEREWPRRPLRRIALTGLIYPLAFQREIGVSQQVVENLDHRLLARLLGRRGIRIYNSLNIDRFKGPCVKKDELRREFSIPEDCVLLCTIGRLTEQKGYGVLLEAMHNLVLSHTNVKLIIVGDGPLREVLKSQMSALGLEGHVAFAGQRSDADNILSIADLFVSSSLWEGLPTVIIESMIVGVPVVATDVSGSRELVQDGVTGYLVKPNDSRELCTKLREVINLLPSTKSISDHARSEVEHRFSIDTASESYMNIYRSVICQKDGE
jgi:glycosyltransferase involved in cell wall biosynthesis